MIRFLQHLDECSGGHPAPPALPSRPRRSFTTCLPRTPNLLVQAMRGCKGCLAGELRPIENPQPETLNAQPEIRNPKPKTEPEHESPVHLSSPIALTEVRRARSSSNLRETEAGPPEARNLSQARDLLRAPSIGFFRKLASNGSKGKTRDSFVRVWPEPSTGVPRS